MIKSSKRMNLVSAALFACALSLTTTARGQETQPVVVTPGPSIEEQNKVEAPANAALKFEKTVHSFGTVQEGEVIEMSFPVKNTSAEVVRITDIQAGCGCTAVAGNPSVINPGEETAFKVQFNSQGRLGANNRSITIRTSDPNNPEYRVSFEGRVTSDLTLSTTVLNFHEIEMGKPSSLEFVLSVKTEKPVKVLQATSEDPRLKVEKAGEQDSAATGEKTVDHKFKVTIPADMPQGDFYTRVSVRTDHEKAPVQYVSVRGRVLGNFDFSPNRLFAVMKVSTEQEKRVTIVARNGETFTVEKTEKNGDITADLSFEDGATPREKVLVAKFKSGAEAKTVNGTIRLLLKQGDGKISPLDIPVIAVVRDQRPAAAPQAQSAIPRPGK